MKARFFRPARTLAGVMALGLATVSAVAVPPAGHPSPEAAVQMMQAEPTPEAARTGQVISHIDASEYTYAEVVEKGEKFWLAAPRTALKDGDSVRFPSGVVMRDFYSKLLNRTFPAVMFVESVEVSNPR